MLEIASEPRNEVPVIEPFELIDLGQILRSARLTVCEAYYSGRHDAALAALAAQSIRLYRWVLNGSLRGDIASETLWEVADNLTLTEHFGEEIISHALDTGPAFYGESNAVAIETVTTPAADPKAAATYKTFWKDKMAPGGVVDRAIRGGA